MKGRANNPRYANGNLRRRYRARFRAMDAPCGICRGALGPVQYDARPGPEHPLGFVIDEIVPVSKWREAGFASPRAAAEDWNNVQAAHWICNARKGNKVGFRVEVLRRAKIAADGDW